MTSINKKDLYEWCKVPADKLEGHPMLKTPFRLVENSEEMGLVMARELVEEINHNNSVKRVTRAIIPCGPSSWYKPFREIVNFEMVSLKDLYVFHMDECLDWEGRLLPKNHPYNFRTFMEKHFYGGIKEELAVPEGQRYWLNPSTMETVRKAITVAPIDIVLGGWGQDGHVAYNQARRHPFSTITIEELKNSSIRIQENNLDTIMALAQRTFGAGYQFVPPMSITLGLKEILAARKIRIFSDTGAWKQTALRVGLFGPPNPEYPMTLLQEHSDPVITATKETARHPISEHPEWDLLSVG